MNKKRYIPLVLVGAIVLSLFAAFTAFGADDIRFVVAGDIDGSNTGTLIDPTPDDLEFGQQGGEFGIYIKDEDANAPVRRVLVPSDGMRPSGAAYPIPNYAADGTAPVGDVSADMATVDITAHSSTIRVRTGELAISDYVMIGDYTVRRVTEIADSTAPTSSAVTGDDVPTGAADDPVVWALTVPLTEAHFNDDPTNDADNDGTTTNDTGDPFFTLGTVDFTHRAGWLLNIKSDGNLPAGLTLASNDATPQTLASDANNTALTSEAGYVAATTVVPEDTGDTVMISAAVDAALTAVTSPQEITLTLTYFDDSTGTTTGTLEEGEATDVKTLVVHLLMPDTVLVTLDRPFAEDGDDTNNEDQPIYKLLDTVTDYSGWADSFSHYAMGKAVGGDDTASPVTLLYPIADSGLSRTTGEYAELKSGSRSGRVRTEDVRIVSVTPADATADPPPTVSDVTNEDTVAFANLSDAGDIDGYLLYWSVEPNEISATVSSQGYADGTTVALRETQHNSGFFALRMMADMAGDDVEPDTSVTVPSFPVNPRDVVTVESSGTSGSLVIETSAPSFTGLSPAHNTTGSEDRPVITAQVTDSDAGLKKENIDIFFLIDEVGQNPKGVVVNPHDDGDTDAISGGYEITGRLSGDDAPTKDATISWWLVATDNAGNVGYSDQKPTDSTDGSLDPCTETSASAGTTPAEMTTFMNRLAGKGCQPYVVRVDNTNPKLLRAETGRNWNSALQTGDSKDKTEYRVNKANKTSVLVVFDEHLDATTVSSDDFEVNGSTPADTSVYNVTVRDDVPTGTKPADLADDADAAARTAYEAELKAYNDTFDGNPDIAGDSVQDVEMKRGYVFLRLSADLDADAEPKVELTGEVLDLAGNEQDSGVDNDALDRIAPTLTVTIDEGSRPVTMDKVNLTITSDENIGTPKVTFRNVMQKTVDDKTTKTVGASIPGTATFVSATEYTAVVSAGNSDDGLYTIHVEATDAAGGNMGMTGDMTDKVDVTEDTKAILFEHDENIGKPDVDPDMPGIQNTFETDDMNGYIRIDFSAEANEYDMQMMDDERVGDDLDTHHGVTIVSAMLNDEDITASLQSNSAGNVFLYRAPAGLAVGEHMLEVIAMDAAGNKHAVAEEATIEIVERKPFSLKLNPGWNLVSIPGEPADPDINVVIPADRTDITSVLAYDPTVPGLWLSASRGADGMFSGTLKNITATRGYWIETNTFTALPVMIPKQSPGQARVLPTIPVAKGWNMVPILDVDGNFKLEDGNDARDDTDKLPIMSMEGDMTRGYLDGLEGVRAYTFNTITNRWQLVDEVQIGKGYWVYVSKSGIIVP